MNNQEIFNTVAAHLLKQGKKSAFGDGDHAICRYRGPDGLKCAIGALIKDEFYSPDIEGKTPESDSVKRALSLSGVEIKEKGTLFLLCDLQDIHDDDEVIEWPGSLLNLSKRLNLSSDILKNQKGA